MAAVGLDMEEKKEKVEKEMGDRVDQLKGEKQEHSLEGDFQFLPSELAMQNPEQVITVLGATFDGTFFCSGFSYPLD